MIHFECPACAAPFDVDERLAGRAGRCKRCGGRMKIPCDDGLIGPRRTSGKLPLPCLPPPRLEFNRDRSTPDRFFPPQVNGYAHERQPPGNAIDQESPVREVDHQESGRPHLHRRDKKPR
jgi:predicted Zn finger-like uncharacterized protein